MPRRPSVNRRKKVLRTLVGDSTVDKALREVYDRLDELQPEIVANESPLIPRESVVGSTMLATNDQGEYVLSVKTSEGWMTDINSKLVPIMKGFKPSLGLKSNSNNPIKNEALLYDSSGNIKIEDIPQVTSDTDKFLVSDGGTIKYVTGDTLRTYIDGLRFTGSTTNGVLTYRDADSISVESNFTFDGNTLRLNAATDPTNDYATFSVASTGDLTIATAGDGSLDSDLILDIDGDIELNADGGDVSIKNNTQLGFRFTTGITDDFTMYNPADTNDYFRIKTMGNGATTISTVDAAGADANMTFSPDGVNQFKTLAGGLYSFEIPAAGADITAYGQLWVKNDTPNNLYFTDDTGQDVALTNNGNLPAKTRVWTNTSGGYKLNNNSATYYYFQNYPNYHSWGNYDSSPTSITYYDSYSYQWCAPVAGVLKNISVTCRASDTGTTDPLKFYVYKGVPGDNASATTLTLIGNTDTITPIASKQMFLSTDISSSNDFAAGDKLWVMYKKNSTSGNQDLYFAVTISGEYT